jgi:hypothetical protein
MAPPRNRQTRSPWQQAVTILAESRSPGGPRSTFRNRYGTFWQARQWRGCWSNFIPASDKRAPSTPAERPKTPAFDSMWPKAPRPIRSIQSAPSQAAAVPPAIERQQNTEQGPDMAASTAVQQTIAQEAARAEQGSNAQGADAYNEPVPISVLRSGIVDGMADTLYSDGSIEAQLPGILRFGSIIELRHHLEQGV